MMRPLSLHAMVAVLFVGAALPALAQNEDLPDKSDGAQAPAPPSAPPSEVAAPAPEQALPAKPPAQEAPPPVTPSGPDRTAEVFVPPETIGDVQLSLEDLLNLKVTVASKTEETAAEAPSMVTVFTQADIRRLGVRTVEQLLNFVPGYHANPDESDHYWRVDVRGRNTTAGESMLMLVDGQRVNDLFFGGINTVNHGIPTENIERIEIIRGPGSALYGANAFLGIINIKTNRTRNDVTAGAGNMTRRYAALNLAKSYGDLKLASFAKVYTDTGDFYRDTTDADGLLVTAKDPVRAIDTSAALEYQGLYLRARYLTRSFPGMNCCAFYSQYGSTYDAAQTTAQAGYKRALTSDIDLDASVGFQREEYASTFPLSMGGPLVRGGMLWRTWGLNSNVDLQWRLLSRDGIKAALLAGGTYAHARLPDYTGLALQGNDLVENPTAVFGDPSRAAERNIAAGYLQAKVELWSQLALTVGARYDWYTDFGKSVNPRAALVWATPIKSHLKVAYGRAFRAPTMYEVGLGIPSLKPETVQTLEAGYVQQILDVAQATVDVFYQRLDDVIGYVPESALANITNTGHIATKGVELELRTREVYGASLMGSYTHLMRPDSDAGLASADFGSVAANYTWDRFTVNVNSTIASKTNVAGLFGIAATTYERPAHALLNARLQLEVAKGMRAFTTVNNVLDWRYQPAGMGTSFFQRGRTFMVGLSADL